MTFGAGNRAMRSIDPCPKCGGEKTALRAKPDCGFSEPEGLQARSIYCPVMCSWAVFLLFSFLLSHLVPLCYYSNLCHLSFLFLLMIVKNFVSIPFQNRNIFTDNFIQIFSTLSFALSTRSTPWIKVSRKAVAQNYNIL